MNKMYVIQWKSTVNGRAGKGSKRFNREEAELLVEELNREYPQIHHELVSAGSRGETEHAIPESESEYAKSEELELVVG